MITTLLCGWEILEGKEFCVVDFFAHDRSYHEIQNYFILYSISYWINVHTVHFTEAGGDHFSHTNMVDILFPLSCAVFVCAFGELTRKWVRCLCDGLF